MATLPIADVRAQLSKLVDEASSTHERIEITKNGRRAAILIGADDYDALRETISVLSDPGLMLAHLKGIQELSEDDALNSDQLSEAMKHSRRSVDPK